MNELTLARDSSIAPDSAGLILWQGRECGPDSISLENELEKRLLDIRAEHMEWAFRTGELPAGNSNLQKELECGAPPSMWWTSLIYERHPKLSPYLYVLYKLRCLELLLEEKRPQKLTVIGANRQFRKAIAALCKSLRIAVSFRKGDSLAPAASAGLAETLYWFLPAPVRAAARFIHWHWKIRRKLAKPVKFPAFPSQGSLPPATIATYFPNIDLHAAANGRFRSRYWENLHDLLNAQAKKERPDGPHFVRWLLIRFPSPDLDFEECLRLRDRFQQDGKDGLSFNYLEEFLTAPTIIQALSRWIRLCISNRRARNIFSANCHFAGSALDFSHWMKAQWTESICGWRSLERCLFNAAFDNYCKRAGIQRWTLFPLENCPWERMLTIAARRISDNGPVYGAQHSTVRPTDFRYFDAPQTFSQSECAAFQPDKIAANGNASASQWHQNGMPPDRLVITEALRYLYLAHTLPDNAPENPLPPEPGEPLENNAGKRLLILTSFFRDETETQLSLLQDCLNANLFSGWNLTLKPHPFLFPQKWLDSLPKPQRDRIFVSHAPLSGELKAGTNVWASNSTTASLEAAIRGLPVMVMASRNDFDLCPIQEIPGLIRTATLEDVKNGLMNLQPLALPPDYLDLNPDLDAWRKLLGFKDNGYTH